MGSSAIAADAASTVGVPRAARVEVSIAASYNMRSEDHGAFTQATMLREVRAVEVEAGHRTLEWLELPETAVVETAQVSLVSPSAGVRVVGIRVVEPQLSPAAIAAALRGAPVLVDVAEEEMRRRRGLPPPLVDPGPHVSLGGAIVSTRGGLVLRVGKELTVLPPSTVRTETAMPGRRLFVELEVAPGTPRARVTLQLDALLDKVVFHTPHYVLQTDAALAHGRLTGAMLLSNLSGYPLDGAKAFYARPDASSPARPYARRDSETSTGVAETWAASMGAKALPPFAFMAPVAFGPQGLADVPVIASGELPLAFASAVRVANTMSLTEKTSDPQSLPLLRTFTLDISSQNLAGATLPSGPVVLLSASSAGPPQPMGEAFLRHLAQQPQRVIVEAMARQWDGENVAVTQLSNRRLGKCTVQSSFRYDVPSALLAKGRFEVQVPFPKKVVTVTLSPEAQRAGATISVDDAGSRVVVPARTTPSTAPVYPLAVQYKVQGCDL